MAETVGMLIEGNVKPGQLDAFNELKEEMVEGTSAEPGALNYEWYLSEDGTTFAIWEKYADSDATMAHFGGFGKKWSVRFRECCQPTRFIVYGSPDERVVESVARSEPVYMRHWGGFAR